VLQWEGRVAQIEQIQTSWEAETAPVASQWGTVCRMRDFLGCERVTPELGVLTLRECLEPVNVNNADVQFCCRNLKKW